VRRFLPYLAASFTGIQVGAALVASEAVVEKTGAAGLGFWRYLIASIVLVPFWIASRKPRIGRGDLLPISIIGIGQSLHPLRVCRLYSQHSRLPRLHSSV
jgi:threonine/homoserine efflux transporter RhtA